MMTGGGPTNWHTVRELIETGQYEQAVEFLHEAQLASQQRGDAVLADTLAAACQICLACSQCQTEVEWHRTVRKEAERREQELRGQLYAILERIGGRESSETPGAHERPPDVPPVEMSPPDHGTPELVERLSLVQRIQSPLGRRTGPRSPEREAPVPPAAEKAGTPSAAPVVKEGEQAPPSLAVYCLGPFRVYQDEKLITDWPSGKGKCIFKYMIANRARPIPKDILMDLFWRDAAPAAVRNNLNVAIYGLRQALRAARPAFSHVLFQDDHYLLNPNMAVWVDFEEFVQRCEAGRSFEKKAKLAEAIREYEIAEGLYQGDFFKEDLYEDWPIPRREGLKDSYLVVLDRLSRYYLEQKRYTTCIHLSRRILTKDDCREGAHRRLMRCYSRQGQRNLALRQYHLCVETLARVLDVPPMQETATLYHQIRRGETV